MDDLQIRQRGGRDVLLEALRNELLGPAGGEDEVLGSRERPSLRYLLGRLAPVGTGVSAEEDDGAAEAWADDDDAEAGYASPISMAMNPSSIGLSFVTRSTNPLTVTATWGRYVPDTEETVGKDGRAGSRTVWQREPVAESVIVDPSEVGRQAPKEVAPGVTVEAIVRAAGGYLAAVSVFLVNRQERRNADRPEEDEWLFQSRLRVTASDGSATFEARRLDADHQSEDPDLQAMELLHWNRPEFAVGHGCAVDWSVDDPESRRAVEVHTEMLPSYELPRIDPRNESDAELDMRVLGGPGDVGVSGRRLREMLLPLAEGYGDWIENDLRKVALPAVAPELREVALGHIEGCDIARERIIEGIELLAGTDDRSMHARSAFCFANRAMALQRERSERALRRRRGLEDPGAVPARWRPFQLAFVLLNLPSMVDRAHADRRVADLLWFPTGGGKTEAYLGLTAFALAHRRLRQPVEGLCNDAGVSVLMRYTLRLLTIQQFQRATTLICACELLRRTEGTWGEEPFSIGLWVGRSATPNQYTNPSEESGAKEALKRLADGHRVRDGSPIQLLTCPWCGARLTHEDYTADDDENRVYVHCSDDTCAFSPQSAAAGIPAHMVDEQLYHHVPSLVIATVDKYARMPWNGRVQALFGRVSSRCERHGWISDGEGTHPRRHRESASAPAADRVDVEPLEPPDLIIQDELHLISGPLGTLVGLYESAVDLLASCRVDGVLLPAKVIASTATIRRAEQQVGALFNRGLQIFPPSGLESGDSWFGREVDPVDEPGRMYVGVSAPGRSVKTALVRVYASLLSRARGVHEADPEAGDPYMTLVGYFNSLRELGGALRLVDDDVPGRIKVLHRRDKDLWPTRLLFEREELTSNKKAEEIPAILEKLERQFTADRPASGRYPVDTILASNMISVGVDIDRLGLMVVNGQPKTTAEYIQATSRVGRRAPGLVVTVYNWTRPRDLSHYERFRSFHSTLYRFVEATSVTPFSSRARDKGLEGVLTALLRLGDPGLTPEQAAGTLEATDAWVDEVITWLAKRAADVTGSADVGAETREEAKADLDRWSGAASPGALCYTKWGLSRKDDGSGPDTYLLGEQEAERHEGIFEAPGSLREVEGEVPVYLREVLPAGGVSDE